MPKWLHDPDTPDAPDNDVLEHGSAYGYSVGQSASVNGVGSISMGGRGETEEVEEEDEGEQTNVTKEEDVDELMEWQGGGGDYSLEASQDDIPPIIATLGEDD